LRQRPAPGDALGEPQLPRPGAELSQPLAAADMGEPPCKLARQQRQRLQQHVQPLLLHRPAHAQQLHRLASAIARRALPRRLAEAAEVEAVMAEVHPLRLLRQFAQARVPGLGAGDRPARRGELLRQVLGPARPDVLGMGRARPWQPRQQGGILGHRRRGMHEMGMQVPDVGGQFAGEHQRLAPAPHPVAGEIALEVGEEAGARRPVARHPPGPPPVPDDAQRLVVEILRQVGDGRLISPWTG
jgi:hypothetical protein